MSSTSSAAAETIYGAMLAEARRVGLPKSFTTDLTLHDRQYVATHPGASFVWALYQDGTHIVTPGHRSRSTLREVHQTLVDSGACRLYWVSAFSVTPVTLDEALERIDDHLPPHAGNGSRS